MNQSKMAQALRQAGYRLSQPRLAILQVLEGNDAGLSPEEIHQQAKALCASLRLVTVYRTLELLTELGVARRVHSEQRCHGYVIAGARRHYVICEKRHRVVEFPWEGLDDLIESVRQQTGYIITQHLPELSGLCPACQADRSS
jgi:Fur family ferric uptake transcriptional regulator